MKSIRWENFRSKEHKKILSENIKIFLDDVSYLGILVP